MKLLFVLWLLWKFRLLPPDKEFWRFVWGKFLYETVSGYGPGEVDHWPEAAKYS